MIGVLGSGSWATCIVKILLEKEGRSVNWLVRDQEIADGVCRCGKNPRYLCNTYLDPNRLNISTDIREVVEASDELYLVVPSAFIAQQLSELPKELIASKVWISAVKGMVSQSDYVVSDYLHFELGVPFDNIAVASGPTHAEELSCAQNSVISVASCNMELAKRVSKDMRCSYLYTYCTDAMRSVEYAGVLKNVYAVASGILFGIDSCSMLDERNVQFHRQSSGSKTTIPRPQTAYSRLDGYLLVGTQPQPPTRHADWRRLYG